MARESGAGGGGGSPDDWGISIGSGDGARRACLR